MKYFIEPSHLPQTYSRTWWANEVIHRWTQHVDAPLESGESQCCSGRCNLQLCVNTNQQIRSKSIQSTKLQLLLLLVLLAFTQIIYYISQPPLPSIHAYDQFVN